MTDFVRRFVHHVVHPGPCPPGWAPLAALTLGVIGAALVIIVGAGWMDGRPAKHFGESRSGTFLSASLLLVSAGLCGTIASDRKARRMRWFWLAAAVGFGLLTYDELGMGHEKLSKHVHLALGWDPAHPVTTRLDDVVVLVYGLAAAAWAFRYRNSLLRLRWTTSVMTLAGVAFLCTVGVDLVRGWPATEESFKIISEGLIVVALLAARLETRAATTDRTVHGVTGQVGECLTRGRGASSPP
jgi:hypothetical protein